MRIAVIPAAVLIVLGFLSQLLNAGTVATTQTAGVAYLAHMGGCVFSAATVRLFEDPHRARAKV